MVIRKTGGIMKMFIALLLALSITICICGCSKQENNETTEETLVTEESTVTATEDVTVAGTETATATEAMNVSEIESTYAQYIPIATETIVNTKPLNDSMKLSDFQPICQLPELPTGCEITSLAMVLNYYGYNVNKCELANNYLETGDVGETNFYKAFVGLPSNSASFGCYAPVIANAANNYLLNQGSNKKARAMSGVSFSTALQYIDKSVPVIIWGTLNCQPGYPSVTWTVDGENLTWITPEHCMVLVGYDKTYVRVADPMTGHILSYEKNLFAECFRTLHSQIVIIE